MAFEKFKKLPLAAEDDEADVGRLVLVGLLGGFLTMENEPFES